jgi:hypothetical protein
LPLTLRGGGGCPPPPRVPLGCGRRCSANRATLAFSNVQEFVRSDLVSTQDAVAAVGSVPTDVVVYAANQAELEAAVAGMVPSDGPDAGGTPAA